MDNNRNLILATALSFLVILAWTLLLPPEERAPGVTPDTPLIANGDLVAEAPGVAPAPPPGLGGAVPARRRPRAPPPSPPRRPGCRSTRPS